MAQRVQVLLVCDLHDGEVEGSETVSFALDGTSYEIDLCEEHAAALRDDVAPYVGEGRRAGRQAGATARRSGRPARAPGTPAATDKERTVAIREWARTSGHKVNDRGRLPQAVVDAYDAAH